MFGNKQIVARIVNGQLLVRVGGGFMAMDRFIDQYGHMEMLKLIKKEDKKEGRASDA